MPNWKHNGTGITEGHPGAWSGDTVGAPDGVATFRPEFGRKVGAFTKRRKDLDPPNWHSRPPLMFHVPREFRGNYRPGELANFNPEYEYIVDSSGYRMCEANTQKGSGLCKVRAANRQPYCESHGARLHPLDKISPETMDPAKMSRYQLLLHGYIDVDDLTDEEVTNGMMDSGGPQHRVMLPRELYRKILDRHYARAEELLKESLIPAIMALSDIAANKDDIYEAADRSKAAQFIVTRVMGNNPQVVQIGAAKEPWQQLVAGMATTSRSESRAQRGMAEITDGSENAGPVVATYWDRDNAEIMDAEVVDVPGDDDSGVVGRPRSTESVPAESVTVSPRTRKRPTKAVGDDTRVPGTPAKVVVKRPKKATPVSGRDSAEDGSVPPKVRMKRPSR